MRFTPRRMPTAITPARFWTGRDRIRLRRAAISIATWFPRWGAMMMQLTEAVTLPRSDDQRAGALTTWNEPLVAELRH